MPYILTIPGLIIVVIGFAVGALSVRIFPRLQSEIPFIIASLVWIVGDLLYRSRSTRVIGQLSPLIHPRLGGSFFFIPVWILGVIFFLVNLVKLF